MSSTLGELLAFLGLTRNSLPYRCTEMTHLTLIGLTAVAVSVSNRAKWEAICDYIEAELATINLQVPGCRWSRWSEARATIEGACGPLDNAFADYAKDFLSESMGLTVHPPQSPSLHKPAVRRQRRSRARDESTRLWDDLDCHPPCGGRVLPQDGDWLDDGFPSDFDDLGEW